MSIDITPNKEGKSNNYKSHIMTNNGTVEITEFELCNEYSRYCTLLSKMKKTILFNANNTKKVDITYEDKTTGFHHELYIDCDYEKDKESTEIIHNISDSEETISALYIKMCNNSVEEIYLQFREDESYTDVSINAIDNDITYKIIGGKYGIEEKIISSKIEKVEEVDKTTFNHSIKEGDIEGDIEREIKIYINSSTGEVFFQVKGEDNLISIYVDKRSDKEKAESQIEKKHTPKSSVTLGAIGEHSAKSLKIPRVNTSPNKNCCDTPTA